MLVMMTLYQHVPCKALLMRLVKNLMINTFNQ